MSIYVFWVGRWAGRRAFRNSHPRDLVSKLSAILSFLFILPSFEHVSFRGSKAQANADNYTDDESLACDIRSRLAEPPAGSPIWAQVAGRWRQQIRMRSASGTPLLVTSTDAMKASLTFELGRFVNFGRWNCRPLHALPKL